MNGFNYEPSKWYWLADDGRIFSSAQQSIVAADDAGYVAWREAGGSPTSWPRDASGAQTSDALQDVLAPYGLFASLQAYAASVRYSKEVGGFTVNGVKYPSDRESQAKLTAAALFAQVDNTKTFVWKLDDGTFSPSLNATQMIEVAAAVGGYVNDCFAKEATTIAAITAGTITTRDQVDAGFA